MRILPLTQGLHAIVDDADFEWLKCFSWYAANVNGRFYAMTCMRDGGRQLKVPLHHMLAGCPLRGLVVDHADGCTLHDSRTNLRVCTRKENSWNTGKREGATSLYKGVSWCRTKKRWRAAIMADGKTHFGGYFRDEREAARRYDELASRFYGKFARTSGVQACAGNTLQCVEDMDRMA